MATNLNKGQRAEVERVAWQLYTEKMWTHQRICDHVNAHVLKGRTVSRQTIGETIKRVEQRFLEESDQMRERIKAQQTQTLTHLAAELLDSFEKSKEVGRHVTSTKRANEPGGDGDLKTTETITTEINEQYGDMRIADELRKTLADIRAIWGVDDLEKAKGDLARAVGEKLNQNLVELSDEELIAIASQGINTTE